MQKIIPLFFFSNNTGIGPIRQPCNGAGLLCLPFIRGIKEDENKIYSFLNKKRMINWRPYMPIKFLLSFTYLHMDTTLTHKKHDGAIKMSLQYIGNVYRFVKSITLTL